MDRFLGRDVDTECDLSRRMYRSMEFYLKNLEPQELEIPLFSKNPRVAGRADCIGNYKGELSIVDFKTSTKEKKREWITDYFIQTTA